MTRPKLDEDKVTGALAERTMPDGRRRLKLNKREKRDLLRREKVEAAVACFLDLERDWKWPEIAAELGMSVGGLKDLTKSELFDQVYNEHFADLGRDPRLKAAQGELVDMVPQALRVLNDLLQNPRTSATVRLNAVKEVMKMAGVSAPSETKTSRNEIAEFLGKHGMQVDNMQVNLLTPEYLRAHEEYLAGHYEEIVDVELVGELPVEEPHDPDVVEGADDQ